MTPRRSPERADPTNRAAFIPRHRDGVAFTGPVDGSRAVAVEMDAVVIVFETEAEAKAHCVRVNAARTRLRTQSKNQPVHLRVMSPTLALDATADYVTILETAMIETTDDLAEPGFCQVRYLGESLLVITADIQERTQQVSRASTWRVRLRLLHRF